MEIRAHYQETSLSKFSREVALFWLVLLVLNSVANVLLVRSLSLFNPKLGAEWNAFAGVSALAAGLAVLWGARELFRDWRRLIPTTVSVGISVVGAAVFWNYQDYSPDGTWYHLERVALFPVDWRIDGFEQIYLGGPSLIYPMLVDNLRGILVSLLGAGAFAGIGINIGVGFFVSWMWQLYADFLRPRWRILVGTGPIAATQLMTYYVDGVVAGFCSLLILLSILVVRSKKDKEEVDKRSVLIAVLLGFTALALSKFSAPLLFISSVAPFAAWYIFQRMAQPTAPDTELENITMFECALLLVVCFGLLTLPYWLLLRSWWVGPLGPFSLAETGAWGKAVLTQTDAIFGENSNPLTRFFRSNILAFWPGGEKIIDPDIHDGRGLIFRLLARIATEDARFSGFGAFSNLILVGSAAQSVSILFLRRKVPDSRFEKSLAAAFLFSVLLACVAPLGWWPRNYPVPYFFAAIIFVRCCDRFSGFARRASFGFVAITLSCAVVAPATILVARSLKNDRELRNRFRGADNQEIYRSLLCESVRPLTAAVRANAVTGSMVQPIQLSEFVSDKENALTQKRPLLPCSSIQ